MTFIREKDSSLHFGEKKTSRCNRVSAETSANPPGFSHYGMNLYSCPTLEQRPGLIPLYPSATGNDCPGN